MADKKTWNVYIGIPGEDIERVQENYKDVPVRQKFIVDDDIEPTVDDVYRTFPWAKKGNYAVRVQEEPKDKETKLSKAVDSFAAFGNAALDMPTFGLASLIRRTGEALAEPGDESFSDKLARASAIERGIAERHPWATGLGTAAGIGASIRYNPMGPVIAAPLKAVGKLTPGIVSRAVPGFVKGTGNVIYRGAAPGVAFKTADVLSEGRLPTIEEEQQAGGASLAADLLLRGAGKAISKIPGVNRLPYIAAKTLGKKMPASPRTVSGLGLANREAGLNDSTIISNMPPAAPSGSDAPLYAGRGRATDSLLATIKGSNANTAKNLADRIGGNAKKGIEGDIAANERQLAASVKKYLGSKTGVGSPDNLAYRERMLNEKYAGLTEPMNTYDGKKLSIRVTKSSTPEGASAYEQDLLNELNRMSDRGELTLGMSYDPELGTATPAAIMQAARNITKNVSDFSAARAKAVQDVASERISKYGMPLFGKNMPASEVKSYFDDWRTWYREANAFREGREAVASGKHDLLTFIGETPAEIKNIDKIRGSEAAAKAQKGLVDAKRAGIMSNYLDNLYKVVPEGTELPSVYPKDAPVLEMLSASPEGQNLARAMFLHDSLNRSYNILTNPAIQPVTGWKGLASRLIRSIAGRTGTYSAQQLGLSGLDIAANRLSAGAGSKLGSVARMKASKALKAADVDETLRRAVSTLNTALVRSAAGLAGKKAESIEALYNDTINYLEEWIKSKKEEGGKE